MDGELADMGLLEEVEQIALIWKNVRSRHDSEICLTRYLRCNSSGGRKEGIGRNLEKNVGSDRTLPLINSDSIFRDLLGILRFQPPSALVFTINRLLPQDGWDGTKRHNALDWNQPIEHPYMSFAYRWVYRSKAGKVMLLDMLKIGGLMKGRQIPIKVQQPLVNRRIPCPDSLQIHLENLHTS